jgi:hypothetical protein
MQTDRNFLISSNKLPQCQGDKEDVLSSGIHKIDINKIIVPSSNNNVPSSNYNNINNFQDKYPNINAGYEPSPKNKFKNEINNSMELDVFFF